MVDLFLYFQIKALVFVEVLSYSFLLDNSECDASLVVHHSLVYSHPKMFLQFFSLIVNLF